MKFYIVGKFEHCDGDHLYDSSVKMFEDLENAQKHYDSLLSTQNKLTTGKFPKVFKKVNKHMLNSEIHYSTYTNRKGESRVYSFAIGLCESTSLDFSITAQMSRNCISSIYFHIGEETFY